DGDLSLQHFSVALEGCLLFLLALVPCIAVFFLLFRGQLLQLLFQSVQANVQSRSNRPQRARIHFLEARQNEPDRPPVRRILDFFERVVPRPDVLFHGVVKFPLVRVPFEIKRNCPPPLENRLPLRVRDLQFRRPQDQLRIGNRILRPEQSLIDQRTEIHIRFQQLHQVDKPPMVRVACVRRSCQQQQRVCVFPQGFRKLVIQGLLCFLWIV